MKKKFLSGVVLVTAAAVTIVACSKQASTESAAEPAAKEKIEALAQRFVQPIGSDYSRVKEQYSGLSEADLRLFWAAVYRKNHPQENDAAKETAFVAMLDEMSAGTKSQFGVPFNKATKEQIEAVCNPASAKRNRNMMVNGKIVPPPPDPQGCDWLPYPTLFPKTYIFPYSGPANACRTVDYYQDDCDGLELTYNGIYSNLVPITPLADLAVASWLQGDIIFSNGAKTRVLHKKSSAEWFFGAPGCVTINNNFRMGLWSE